MAADATTLTEKMRAALRISSTSEKITAEIEDCIVLFFRLKEHSICRLY